MGPNDSRGAQVLRRLFPDRGGAKAIGELCGVAPSVASRWRRGERRPDSPYRTTMKRELGIDFEWWDEPPLPELADAVTDEVTPAEAPVAKRQSSAPPAATLELVDAVDLDSEGTPTDVNVEPLPTESTPNLPPVATEGATKRPRRDTDPQDPREIEKPLPLHVQAHPELRHGERVLVPDEDDRTSTPTPDP